MDTENKKNFTDNIKDYIKARQSLLKLQATDKASGIIAAFISFLIIFSLLLLAFLFISLTLAHFFAEQWGHEYAGYLTVTILYIIIASLLLKFRNTWLVRPIKNQFIKIILSK